jgi:hypothetical protein
MRDDEDLLTPSLSGAEVRRGMYSSRAMFLVAFIGGPVASTLFGAVNAQRLGTLGRDSPWLIALGVGAVTCTAWIGRNASSPFWSFAILDDQVDSAHRLELRIAGLIASGLVFQLHRKAFRAAQWVGAKPANAVPAGVTCVTLAALIGYALAWALQSAAISP